MEKINCYLFLLFMFALGCGDENVNENQSVKDGEYVIKLYNSEGELLLTKKGNAENLGNSDHWEIRLLDPSFALPNTDPLETFASLTIFTQATINTPLELQFNNDNSASFHQRWYSLEDDWGYRSTEGTLIITSLDKSKIKGSFEINLKVDANAQQNPRWGHHIVAKGYFSSICPYENVGGCP
jgi:hypothetical protein